MDPINPWIDAAEVRQLAEQLLQRTHQPTPPQDAGFAEGFIGFDAMPTHEATAPVAVAPVAVAPVAPAPVAPAPVAAAPAPLPVFTNASSQPAAVNSPWQAFQQRLEQHYSAKGLFVLNPQSEIVYGHDQHPQLQFIARSLTASFSNKGLTKSHIHIKAGPDSVLEIIPILHTNGTSIIGTVVPSPLQTAQISELALAAASCLA